MSRLSRKKTATAVVLAALLGLTILPPPAGAQPLGWTPAGLWQQAWAFLFGGGLTSLRGEEGSTIDPNGQHSTNPPSGGLPSLRGEDGGFMDPNGQHSTNPPSGGLTTLRNAGRVSSHRR